MHIPKIVIPSYNRVDCLKEKTLNTLNRYNYPKDSIYIFVVDDEYEIYKSEFPEYNVIVGLKGLMNQRNFITDYFPENEELVCMDDDIEEICILDPEAKGGISALPDFTQFVL
jgi:cellulose synthase/poly-beta-1,6-N-acetylglucosamine synthase-like glycosyltransferase